MRGLGVGPARFRPVPVLLSPAPPRLCQRQAIPALGEMSGNPEPALGTSDCLKDGCPRVRIVVGWRIDFNQTAYTGARRATLWTNKTRFGDTVPRRNPLGRTPNENAHQLRAILPAPAPTYVPQRAHGGCRPRGRLGARPARRRHARVRQLPRGDILGQGIATRVSSPPSRILPGPLPSGLVRQSVRPRAPLASPG